MVEIRGSVSLTINLSRRRERRRGGIIKRAKKGARGIVIAERETRKEGVEGWKETRRRLEGIRTNGKVVQLNRRKSGEEGRGDVPPPPCRERRRRKTRGSSEIGRRFNPRDNGCERVALHQQFPMPNKDHAGDDRPAISRIQSHGVFYLARIGEEREGRIRGCVGWTGEERNATSFGRAARR